jgi:hypothetical protein
MTTIDERMELFKKYVDYSKMEHKQYQYDGVRWCLNNELRENPICNVRGGFIADEMGLGKTIMMIGLMYSNFTSRTLIILPPILIDQWYLQIYKTTGHKAMIYHGENKKKVTPEQLNSAHIVITSYGAITLTKRQIKDDIRTELHKIKWSRLIFDEAHHLRNSKTTRYISAKMISAKIRWLVSGTPIQNKKQDFYSLCAMLRIPASYYTEKDNLKDIASNFILKRTKNMVGIKMQDLLIENNVVNWKSAKEMELSEEFHSALSFSRINPQKMFKGTLVNSSKSLLTIMLRAKQSCIYPKLMVKNLDNLIKYGVIQDYSAYKEAFDYSSKLDAVIDAVIQNKDNGCGKILFCHYREEIDEIATRLKNKGINKVATFDGRTTSRKRSSILNEKNDVLILQIQTGCEGLNLQENYNEIYFVSPHWNPAVEDQAIARCHRIGQTKPVIIKKFEMNPFIAEDQQVPTRTIDNYVNDVQEVKRNVACEIIGK